MDQGQPPLEQLCAASEARNIPYDREELEADLQNPEHTQWVADNLGQETLLSKDEADLYAKLESCRALTDVSQDPDLPSTRPFLDEEIAAAIESLQTSTAAVDAQTETIKSQYQKLRSILASEDENNKFREQVLSGFRERNVEDTMRINDTVNELRHDFDTKLEKARSYLEKENDALKPGISYILKEHDQVLQRCEELASHHLEEDAENGDEETMNRVEVLSAKLNGLLAEDIRCRLDQVYLKSIGEDPSDESDEDEYPSDQLASIEQEIGTLYSEIDVLAEMHSRQSFHDRILQAIQRKRAIINSTSGKQLDHILTAMSQLTISAEQLNERVQNRQSHQATLNELAAIEKGARVNLLSKTSEANQIRASPTAVSAEDVSKDKSQCGLWESQTSFPSLGAILKRYNTSLPSLLPSSPGACSDTFDEKKQVILQGLEDNYAAIPATLSHYLEPANRTAQLLASSLHADPGEREEQAQKLAALETQLDRIRKGIGALDTDGLSGNPEQERLVERWGG